MKSLVPLLSIPLFSLFGFVLPAAAQDPGRIYAAQCFQCHGTNGISVSEIDSLKGKSEKELYESLKDMQKKSDSGNIMHKHTKSWTDTQLRELCRYLASVNKSQN